MFKIVRLVATTSEKSHANNQRLNSLILLMAIAYSCAIRPGKKLRIWEFKSMWVG
jgi:hypothetical protein